MFWRNNRIWRKDLVCKSSRVASNQMIQRTRWYNKRILRKGYSVPPDFSWTENCKLIRKTQVHLKSIHPHSEVLKSAITVVWSNLFRKVQTVIQKYSQKQLAHEIYYTKYEVLVFLWRINLVLKCSQRPRYYNQHCLKSFHLHFRSLAMI